MALSRRTPVLVGLVAAMVATGLLLTSSGSMGHYSVQVVLPSAANLVKGSPVQIGGTNVGQVSNLTTRDGRAVVEVELDDEAAPLHAGSTATVAWKAALGERVLELEPAPKSNPEVPSGGLIAGTVDRVELDQLLGALDKPTRARIQTLLKASDETFSGQEQELNATLREAGPALQALGEVLKGIGKDGPAIRALVTRLSRLTRVLATRQQDVRGTVEGLSDAARESARYHRQLRAGLRELPGTLTAGRRTLDEVPSAVDAAVPLLDDLAPATKSLRPVARDLRPLLTDLRPAVADLRGTLDAADPLLRYTPGLLDTAHGVAPGMENALSEYQTALDFLRPYTPEVMGYFSNWGSATANYDTIGHYARVFIQAGSTSLNANPGVLPPGVTRNAARVPGELEGQPWTDANGSAMR